MIADVDDRRIGLRARVGPVGRTVCVSCFSADPHPHVYAVDALVGELNQVRHHKCVTTPQAGRTVTHSHASMRELGMCR